MRCIDDVQVLSCNTGRCQVCQGFCIIQYPDAASESAHHQVSFCALVFHILRWGGRESGITLPVLACIETHPQSMICTQKHHLLVARQGQNTEAVSANLGAICESCPGCPEIGGFKQIGLKIIVSVVVYHHPRFTGFAGIHIDVRNPGFFGHAGNFG